MQNQRLRTCSITSEKVKRERISSATDERVNQRERFSSATDKKTTHRERISSATDEIANQRERISSVTFKNRSQIEKTINTKNRKVDQGKTGKIGKRPYYGTRK